MTLNKRIGVLLFFVFIVTGAIVLFYLNEGFQRLNGKINSIKVIVSKHASESPIVYITDSTDVIPNFKEVFFPHIQNDSVLLFDLKRSVNLRQFKLYYPNSVENIVIKQILVLTSDNEFILDLNTFNAENIQIIEQDQEKIEFSVFSDTGLSNFESPRFYYHTDQYHIVGAIILILSFLLILLFLVGETKLLSTLSHVSVSEFGIIIFVLSIFLPQRYFNIALVSSLLLIIRNFNFSFFSKNKVNLIFLSLYFLILLNFLIISPDHNFKSIEKYTLFLVLPIYASCIRSTRLLVAFLVVALIIGTCLLAGAIIDVSIFRNLEIMSFDNFTRTIHPVYYSYLLMLSMVYVELTIVSKYRYFIHLLLISLLILSGSKLIVFLTIIWFVFFVRRRVSMVVIPIAILIFILFTPLKKRFESITELTDLSIISEQPIKDANDPRLNGFTVRVILWQESLKMNSMGDLLLGRGVSQGSDDIFKLKLKGRGLLNHLDYNAHNQYVTTIFKIGLIGLFLVIILLVYSIRVGIKFKNGILITFVVIMSLAMLFESVFERASGIAFFSMVILIITNSELLDDKNQSPSNRIIDNI